MNVVTRLKAEGIALALEKLTGQEPIIQDNETYYSLYWTNAQQAEILETLNEKFASGGESEIRVEWFPVVRPVVIKKALPYAIGIFAAGFIIGKIL